MAKKVSLYYSNQIKVNPDWQNKLSPEEHARFEKMTSPKRRNEFLRSRYFLWQCLALYKIQKQPLKTTTKGKPFLSNIKFNLSHSADSVALAVSPKLEVGVDIEKADQIKHFKEIAERYFSETENQFIFASKKKAEQLKRFRTLWSLKEAFVKAVGDFNESSMKVYFDLKNNKIEQVPENQTVTFFFNAKMALCVFANIKKTDVELFEVKDTKKGIARRKRSLQRYRLIRSD